MKTGNVPLPEGGMLVERGIGAVVMHGIPISIKSVVMVEHGAGKGIVFGPEIRPSGPNVSICPLASVIVSKPVPRVKGFPSINTTEGVAVGVGDVFTPPGSSVNVKPSG